MPNKNTLGYKLNNFAKTHPNLFSAGLGLGGAAIGGLGGAGMAYATGYPNDALTEGGLCAVLGGAYGGLMGQNLKKLRPQIHKQYEELKSKQNLSDQDQRNLAYLAANKEEFQPMNKQAFYNGFIKRAQEYGLTEKEANATFDYASHAFNGALAQVPKGDGLTGALAGGALGGGIGAAHGVSVGLPFGALIGGISGATDHTPDEKGKTHELKNAIKRALGYGAAGAGIGGLAGAGIGGSIGAGIGGIVGHYGTQ